LPEVVAQQCPTGSRIYGPSIANEIHEMFNFNDLHTRLAVTIVVLFIALPPGYLPIVRKINFYKLQLDLLGDLGRN